MCLFREIVSTTVGTPLLGAFIPLEQIEDVCERHNPRLHVNPWQSFLLVQFICLYLIVFVTLSSSCSLGMLGWWSYDDKGDFFSPPEPQS